MFRLQILEALRNGDHYYSKIPLIEYEKRDNILYFRGKKYVLNSNNLRLRII